MAESRNRAFARLAKDVTTEGNIKEEGISSDVTLGGATVYATRAAMPMSGNTAGDQAYVTGNNRLYIWNGSGWYNVALLNLAPSISSVQDSDGGTTPFALSSGGAVTRITITATDSDGDSITYSATADSDFNGLATVSNSDNVFTITPFSQDSATTTSGTITFTATDGINVASSGVQTFTLDFAYKPQASQFSDGGLLANGSTWGANTSGLFGLKVSPDGSRMWLMHTGNQYPERAMFQLDLTTPYDVTTATNSTFKLGNFQGDFVWSTDGYTLLTQEDTGYVAKRTCSTPYDITTASEPTPPGDYINVGTSQRITGMQVSPDGLRLLAISQVSSNDRKIQEFTMSSPNNFSSLTLTSTGSRVLSTTGSTSMVYNNDGTKLYVAYDYYIDEYNVTGTPYGTSLSTRQGRFTANSSTFGTTGVGFFNSDGTELIAYSQNRREVRLINTGL